jgi:hypothetical protein
MRIVYESAVPSAYAGSASDFQRQLIFRPTARILANRRDGHLKATAEGVVREAADKSPSARVLIGQDSYLEESARGIAVSGRVAGGGQI